RPAAPPMTSSRLLIPREGSSGRSGWSDMDYLLDAVELLALGSHDDLGNGHGGRLAERVDHRLGHVLWRERLDLVEQRLDLRVATGERRVDQAGLDQRDPDPGREQLQPQRVREAHLGPLRGDV